MFGIDLPQSPPLHFRRITTLCRNRSAGAVVVPCNILYSEKPPFLLRLKNEVPHINDLTRRDSETRHGRLKTSDMRRTEAAALLAGLKEVVVRRQEFERVIFDRGKILPIGFYPGKVRAYCRFQVFDIPIDNKGAPSYIGRPALLPRLTIERPEIHLVAGTHRDVARIESAADYQDAIRRRFIEFLKVDCAAGS